MRIKNIKKKMLKAALAAALLGAVSLTGCSGGDQAAAENNGESVNAENQAEAGDDAQSEGDALQRIMDRGELIVATEGCRTDFADIQNKKECGGNRQWQNHYLRNWAANTKGKGII